MVSLGAFSLITNGVLFIFYRNCGVAYRSLRIPSIGEFERLTPGLLVGNFGNQIRRGFGHRKPQPLDLFAPMTAACSQLSGVLAIRSFISVLATRSTTWPGGEESQKSNDKFEKLLLPQLKAKFFPLQADEKRPVPKCGAQIQR